MSYPGVVAAVFSGNILFAIFMWGYVRVSRYQDDNDIPWSVYGALLGPLCAVIICFIAAGQMPQFLAAFAAQ